MSSEWPIKSIEECASNEPYSTQIGPFGKALVADEYVTLGVPVLRGVNVNRGRFYDDDFVFITEEKANQLAKFESLPGDVLLVHKGTLGKIGLMPYKRKYPRYIMGNSMLRVRCNPTKLLPKFLYYWLSSPAGQSYLFGRVSQVGVPQLQHPLTTLRQARLPVPSLAVQQAIIEILDSLDAKIEHLQRINETLEDIAATIFKRWFIDFEFPNGAGKPYKSSEGEMVHSEELRKEVPMGWTSTPFSSAIAVNPKRELVKGKTAKKVGMADLNPWQSWVERCQYEEYKSGPRFRNGDTLFARITPSLEHGKTAIVSILDNDEVGFGSTEFIIFGKKAITSESFIFHLARSDEIRSKAIGAMTGTSGRQRVPEVIFDSLKIPVPPADLVERFHKTTMPQLDRIFLNAREIKTLSEIRDNLLPKLMSGKIRVPVEAK